MRGHRPGRPVLLAERDPADRSSRTAASRRPNQPPTRPRIPVLGPLHRPRRRPRHPGPPDAGPRPRRGPHRPAQRLRPVAVPVHRLRRQRGVASCRVLGSGPGPLVPGCSVSPGPLARALPKRLRWQLWHTPARIVRKARGDIIRILDGWPTAPDILAAYRHVAALT